MIHTDQPLASVAGALAAGQVSSTELVEAAISRHQPQLNAYIAWAPEYARRQADAADAALRAGIKLGPLTGIPVSVKDHFGVVGLPMYAGTARELPQRWQQEGPVVTSLRRQLAVITGKTQSVELAFGAVGLNRHHGTPRNPWDSIQHRAPGGSSSGAGVSLQEGTAFLALGTDTAGSVRIPASFTGCVGLKLTAGRWSTAGIVPLSSTLDTPGLLARSVADVAYGFAALDPAWGDPQRFADEYACWQAADVRIGVADSPFWSRCEPSIAAVVRAGLDKLAHAGVRLGSAAFPEAEQAQQLLQIGSVVSAECDAFLEAELPDWRPLLDPIISSRIADGGTISARDYLHRLRRHAQLSASALLRFAPFDVIAAPTVPVPPPLITDLDTLEAYRPKNFACLSHTCVANYLGLCAISLPVGFDVDGLPVGLMLMALPRHEERLLAVALVCEQILQRNT